MQDFLLRLLRNACFAFIALIGAVMAFIFMLSTIIAVGLIFIVAKLRGKPFGVRAYWQARGPAMNPFNASGRPYAKAATDVIDVEAREIR